MTHSPLLLKSLGKQGRLALELLLRSTTMTTGESSPKVDQKYVQSELTGKKTLKI